VNAGVLKLDSENELEKIILKCKQQNTKATRKGAVRRGLVPFIFELGSEAGAPTLFIS
jgi:hypothetical protein